MSGIQLYVMLIKIPEDTFVYAIYMNIPMYKVLMSRFHALNLNMIKFEI